MKAPGDSRGNPGPHCWHITAVLLICGFCPALTFAQQGELPNPVYYQGLSTYYAGEYRDAMRVFRESARGGLIDIQGRWVDSICYYTMLGECLYQQGELKDAVDQYDAALRLFVTYRDWMVRVEFPDTIEGSDSSVRSRIRWVQSKRPSRLGRYPRRYSIATGRLRNDLVLRQGGAVLLPEYRAIRVHEVVRCTVLAMRRRQDILGVTCPIDPLTKEVLNVALSRNAVPQNHWSRAWANVQLGMAYAAAGRKAEASAALNESLLVANQFDHPMTGAALLQLGKFAYQDGSFDSALELFQEASLAAGQFGQFDDVEEALRFAAAAYSLAGNQGLYPPLNEAAGWAGSHGARAMQASLGLLAAEKSLDVGRTPQAAGFLRQSERALNRSDIASGMMGVRYHFHTARLRIQQGRSGEDAFKEAIVRQRQGSPRLFRIARADKMFMEGQITPRVAAELYEQVLREPGPQDWLLEPRDTFAFIMTPREEAMSHWFELLLNQRRLPERALEIAERIRRDRFLQTLPMGGRLLALRWILEAPLDAISDRAALQREVLRARFPRYVELANRASELRDKLRGIPLAPTEDAVIRRQAVAMNEWRQIVAAQEQLLNDIALSPFATEMAFPPSRSVKQIQEKMTDRQLSLAFFDSGASVYAFLVAKDDLSHYRITDPARLRREISTLLRDMGHYDRNQALIIPQLRNEDWKKLAAKMFETVAAGARLVSWDQYDELVLIPDGPLWYVPFEVLQLPDGKSTVPLAARVRLRYAPTLSTSVPDGRGIHRVPTTALVAGRLFPRDSEEVTQRASDQLRVAVSGTSELNNTLPGPSNLVAALCDNLVVLDDIEPISGGPYSWSPMQIDGGKLEQWFQLPWHGPAIVVLPGFHSAAENGLRGGGSGNEIFLSICGLMACGARTILLSRWRTAGQSSYDLVSEFMRATPRSSASHAWQRSVQLLLASHLDPELEPRIRAPKLDTGLDANHPFFWAGYVLVDTGTQAD